MKIRGQSKKAVVYRLTCSAPLTPPNLGGEFITEQESQPRLRLGFLLRRGSLLFLIQKDLQNILSIVTDRLICSQLCE